MEPLTHHQMLELAAPFSAEGYHVDLESTEPRSRKLVFKARPQVAGDGSGLPVAASEVLVLQESEPERYCLRRAIRPMTEPPAGDALPPLESWVEISGAEPGVLLREIASFPVSRQLSLHAGVLVAWCYRLELGSAPGDQASLDPIGVHLVESLADIGRLRFRLHLDPADRLPGRVELTPAHGTHPRLPADLLAVLGWSWRPLREFSRHWSGSVRLAPQDPQRSQDARRATEAAVAHLARTLTRPPESFHRDFSQARSRVRFRRALPLLIGIGLLALTPLLNMAKLDDASVARMLIYNLPPILLVAFFSLRELPTIEIPPQPRPLATDAWDPADYRLDPDARDRQDEAPHG